MIHQKKIQKTETSVQDVIQQGTAAACCPVTYSKRMRLMELKLYRDIVREDKEVRKLSSVTAWSEIHALKTIKPICTTAVKITAISPIRRSAWTPSNSKDPECEHIFT